jgi:hypothetical protein
MLLCLIGIVWCLSGALGGASAVRQFQQDGGDLRLYRAIVERVGSGENYYDAAGEELRKRGYPSASPFNWRSPLYAWLIGNLPSCAWGRALLVLGALIALILSGTIARDLRGMLPAVIVITLQAGAFLWALDGDAFLAQELWAGLLIAISVGAYARGHWSIGLIFGLLALFFRELALPYCAISLGLAMKQRRYKEVRLWLAGFAAYSVFFFFHATEVARHISSADRLPESWLQFGGASFALATSRMNYFLFNVPVWICAIYLPVSLLGLCAWKGETGSRLLFTVGAYVAAFTVVGQPFNDYWGLLYAPLLPFGLALIPFALWDLSTSIRRLLSSRLQRNAGNADQLHSTVSVL